MVVREGRDGAVFEGDALAGGEDEGGVLWECVCESGVTWGAVGRGQDCTFCSVAVSVAMVGRLLSSCVSRLCMWLCWEVLWW